MFHTMLAALELRWVAATVAAASNIDSNSSRIDMQDYESAMFIAPVTDSVATGVATLKVEGNDADSDVGMAAIDGASVSLTSVANDDINNKLLIVEVRNPATRYIQAVRTSAAANIAFGETVVLLKPREKKAVQGATVGASAFVSD